MAKVQNGFAIAALKLAAEKKDRKCNVPGTSVPALYKLRLIEDSLWSDLAPNLEECSFAYQKLDSLPNTFSSATRLSILRLDGNRLHNLPSLAELTSLKVLSVSYNHLEELHPSISKCTSLETLLCASNDIISLPKDLGACTMLKILDASSNKIKVIDKHVKLENMERLEHLHLDHNGLSKYSTSEPLPSSITVLTMNGSPLAKGLPSGLANVRRLCEFKAAFCFSKAAARKRTSGGGHRLQCLAALGALAEAGGILDPAEAKRLKRQRKKAAKSDDGGSTIESSGNEDDGEASLGPSSTQKSVSSPVEGDGDISPLPTLPVPLLRLELRGNNLPECPAFVALFEHLTVLNVSQNLIAKLPEEITSLPLEELRCDRNETLTHLPATIGNMSQLRLLCAYECSLSGVPGSLSLLTKQLRYLDLSRQDNKCFRNWSPEFTELAQLRELKLEGNNISSIPGEYLQGLKRLEKLDMSNNRISSLPENLPDCCPMLGILMLKGNGLYSLPECLSRMIMLKQVSWDEPIIDDDSDDDDDDSDDDSDNDDDDEDEDNDGNKNAIGESGNGHDSNDIYGSAAGVDGIDGSSAVE